jgi:hypothetical protein
MKDADVRWIATLAIVIELGARAHADCAPDCVPGGGPATTDCFVAWSGIPATSVRCTDGDPSCDLDSKADGACTLALQGCINVRGLAGCSPTALIAPPSVKPSKVPAARALAAAFEALDPGTSGCTPPGLTVPVTLSLAGIGPGKLRLTVTASADGKRDRDKLVLTCLPGSRAPSLSLNVQPILTARCAIPSCHSGPQPSGHLDLSPGQSWASEVNVPSTSGDRARVMPGSPRQSELAHRILGVGLPPGRRMMPEGCPDAPPASGCLTRAEIVTLLSWIQNQAPND